jgi:hypothetical protein
MLRRPLRHRRTRHLLRPQRRRIPRLLRPQRPRIPRPLHHRRPGRRRLRLPQQPLCRIPQRRSRRHRMSRLLPQHRCTPRHPQRRRRQSRRSPRLRPVPRPQGSRMSTRGNGRQVLLGQVPLGRVRRVPLGHLQAAPKRYRRHPQQLRRLPPRHQTPSPHRVPHQRVNRTSAGGLRERLLREPLLRQPRRKRPLQRLRPPPQRRTPRRHRPRLYLAKLYLAKADVRLELDPDKAPEPAQGVHRLSVARRRPSLRLCPR